MPQIPNRGRRVACRYLVRRLDDYYWAMAYDQGNNRYTEADYLGNEREQVCQVARDRVNKSYTAPIQEEVKVDGNKED